MCPGVSPETRLLAALLPEEYLYQRNSLRGFVSGHVREFGVAMCVLQHQHVRQVFNPVQRIRVSISDYSKIRLPAFVLADGSLDVSNRFPGSPRNQYVQLAHNNDS